MSASRPRAVGVGVHGRALVIDVTNGRAHWLTIPPEVSRSFLGGVGLASWALARLVEQADAWDVLARDPLDPRAPLIFAFSPLVGSPLTTSAKFAVAAVSPLTGRFCDALCSSGFALAGKKTGADLVAIVGRNQVPSVLWIDGLDPSCDDPEAVPAIRLEPAGEVWGLPAAAAERRLLEGAGPGWQLAAIGPAGERLIPFATLSHDGRHAGRGGLGAVLGSKRLKAVAVRGQRRVSWADPARATALARDLSARSLGPATAKYRELGTLANLLVFNRFEALPTRNFQSGSFDQAERLAFDAPGFDLAPARRVARRSCVACTIGCEHLVAIPQRQRDQQSPSQHVSSSPPGSGVRLEYESLFALGPLCGLDDPEAVVEATRLCDEAGIDTITTGATLAFLAECAQNGWIDDRIHPQRPDSPRLRFGDPEGFLAALDELAQLPAPASRTDPLDAFRPPGLVQLLAMGSRRAAQVIAQRHPDALRLAPHVKGLELPGYDPRALHALAVGLAVGTRGADHNRSSAYDADFSGRIDRLGADEAIVAAVIQAEDRAAWIDSLILCKFLRKLFVDPIEETLPFLEALCGWTISPDQARLTARRIVESRRLINRRLGWSPAEDTLPPRLFDPPRLPGSPALNPESFHHMIRQYHQLRGLDSSGELARPRRALLGLEAFLPGQIPEHQE